MIHVIIILIVLMIYLRDSGVELVTQFPLSPPATIGATLGAFAALIIWTHVTLTLLARGRKGHLTTPIVLLSDRVLLASRALVATLQAVAIFALGFLDAIRSEIGSTVFVDELLSILPALIALACGWISYYPLERRLREMVQLRAIEQGDHIYPVPTRMQFVMDNIRHHMLIILVPIALILMWSEGLAVLFAALADRGAIATDSAATESAFFFANILGVIAIFILTPVLIAHVWSTIPLPASALRDRLIDLCKAQGVRCRRILVWRTHGLMINGAVMGLLGRFRFILLTDALLDSLPDDQIEAVMAHEVGHVRRHHLPWLMLSLITALSLAYFLVAALSDLLIANGASEAATGAIDLLAFSIATLAGLITFGFISRLFEKQADAFAAQHLSGMTKANKGANMTVTPEGALAMIHALEAVARLNRIPKRRFTWRHGSISRRQNALARAINKPIDALPVDKKVKRVKLACLLAIVLSVIFGWLDTEPAESSVLISFPVASAQ